MSASFEQDYIGLSSGTSSAEGSPDKISTTSSTSSNLCPEEEKNINALNLKETELRLGLPGCESPERKAGLPSGVALFGKSCVARAKRGFSDAIDGSGKWDLSINGVSDVGFGKDGILFAPVEGGRRGGGKNIHTLQSCLPGIAVKDVTGEAVATKPVATEERNRTSSSTKHGSAPASKAQVVGWPPIRSFRKSSLATYSSKENDSEASKSGPSCLYVKVSMDGAPYLRKIDLKTYSNYSELSSTLKMLFSYFTIGQCAADELSEQEGLKVRGLVDILHDSEHVLTYEDKDGDWMLVGDVPWEMFIGSCKRLRIMRGSEAIGLAPRAMQRFKNQS